MNNEIKSEARGGALIVSFNRPDHANAFTRDMANQLFNILKHCTTDHSVRAVLLKGMGGNFMGGFDEGLFAGEFNTALEHANQLIMPYHSAIRELEAMDKPVLAAVDGRVSGPGFSFMLACDLVLAARSVKFNCGFASNAMTPDGGCSFFLPRKIGVAKAAELLMLSESFNSADAERWNLVNAVIDDEKLHETAFTWIDRLAAGPTRAYGGIKKLLLKAFDQDLNAHLGLEHTYWGVSARSFDFRENLRAQASKRPAKFTGT